MELTANPLPPMEVEQQTEKTPLLAEHFTPEQAAALRAELGGPAVTKVLADEGLLTRSVHGVLAQLTEAPTNWHQAVIFALSTDDPDDEEIRASGPRMFVTGVVGLLLQCAVLPRLFVSTIYLPCTTNDDCTVRGMFCAITTSGRGVVESSSACAYCGTWAPLDWQYDPLTFDSYNFPEDLGRHLGFNRTHALEVCTDYTKSVSIWEGCTYDDCEWEGGWNGPPEGRGAHPDGLAYTCVDIRGGPEPPWERVQVMCPGASVMGEPSPKYEEYVQNWCTRCVDPLSGAVDGLTGWLLPANHVNSMALFDHATYLLCGIVISLTIVGELKDIYLCEFLISNLAEKIAAKWRVALELTGLWRRFVFLPGVMITVIGFVLYTGGGAMNVCFSTIALLFVSPSRLLLVAVPIMSVLFITEVDNLAFHVGLSEGTRARVEFAGRLQLSRSQADKLWWSKKTFIVMMPLALVAPLPFAAQGTKIGLNAALISGVVVYCMIGLVEELGGPQELASENHQMLRAARTLGKSMVGLLLFAGGAGLSSIGT